MKRIIFAFLISLIQISQGFSQFEIPRDTTLWVTSKKTKPTWERYIIGLRGVDSFAINMKGTLNKEEFRKGLKDILVGSNKKDTILFIVDFQGYVTISKIQDVSNEFYNLRSYGNFYLLGYHDEKRDERYDTLYVPHDRIIVLNKKKMSLSELDNELRFLKGRKLTLVADNSIPFSFISQIMELTKKWNIQLILAIKD